MRGTVSAGMAFALDELGLVTAFDAVYGASAGAITAAWLLSRPDGLRVWTEPAYAPPRLASSSSAPPRPALNSAAATSASGASAAVFSVRPPTESPKVSRLATDGRLLRAAFEAGRAATHAALAPSTPFDPSSPLQRCRPALLSLGRP